MYKEKSELKVQAETELLNFIIRVSKGKTTSEKEVDVLPEVANLFFGLRGKVIENPKKFVAEVLPKFSHQDE